MRKSLFKSIVPILYVNNLESEVDFYKTLGFRISYEGKEFPNFIALKYEDVEFGLEHKDNFSSDEANRSFYWQMACSDLKKILVICRKKKLKFTKPTCYWERMDAWEMVIKTPNGYDFHLEGPNPYK